MPSLPVKPDLFSSSLERRGAAASDGSLRWQPLVVTNLDLAGGAYRDRTDDPLLAKQVLSQLS